MPLKKRFHHARCTDDKHDDHICCNKIKNQTQPFVWIGGFVAVSGCVLEKGGGGWGVCVRVLLFVQIWSPNYSGGSDWCERDEKVTWNRLLSAGFFFFSYGSATFNRHHLIALNGKAIREKEGNYRWAHRLQAFRTAAFNRQQESTKYHCYLLLLEVKRVSLLWKLTF